MHGYKRGWASKPERLEQEAVAQRAARVRSAANFLALAIEDAKAPKPGNEAWAEANLRMSREAVTAAVLALPSRADAEAALADVCQKHGGGRVALAVREAIAFAFGPEE